MSILIKGMEMPTSCEYCDLCSDDGYCLAMGGYSLWDVLPDDADCFPDDWKYDGCPLVTVPPHGRLIDADAMMEQIEYDTPLSAVFEKTMRRYLHNAPTIIPAEEEE